MMSIKKWFKGTALLGVGLLLAACGNNEDTSNETGGNHPKIIIFDEPAQHSIVTEDVVNLFNQVNRVPGEKQVLLGITLNDTDIKTAVSSYEKDRINVIDVGTRSFKKIVETNHSTESTSDR